MATSLLAPYNWNNLDAEEITTIVKVLAKATQERFNIGKCSMSGTFSTLGSPSDDTLSKTFPWGNNTGVKYELNDGDPLQDYTVDVENLLKKAAQKYADIEKWDDADTNAETTTDRYDLADVADVPATYDNRLLEVTGYTSYPDLSVYAPEELKKWYDMLTTLKKPIRTIGTTNDDYRIYEGIFDQEADPFYSADEPIGKGGAFYAPASASDSTLEDPATTTPYSDFKTDNSALFGTTIDTYNEDTDTAGTFPPSSYLTVYGAKFRRDLSGDYACYIKAWKITYVADYTDLKSTTGTSNLPLGFQNQMAFSYSESFPTGEDTNMGRPYSTTSDDERFYCDISVTTNGNKKELAVDYDIGPATFPTNITDIASNEAVVGLATMTNSSLAVTFLENWDGDGGFEYYTPAP